MNLLRRLTHLLSCREATELLSRREEVALSRMESIKLRLHLAACTACTRFARQLRIMRAAMRAYRSAL